MRSLALLTIAFGLTFLPACAQSPVAPREIAAPPLQAPPGNLMPSAVRGFGFEVIDLEAQRAWYETYLGYKMVRAYARGGKTFEYVMMIGGSGPTLALSLDKRPPGFSSYAHLTLEVPDAVALAAYLQSRGVWTKESVKDQAYRILDPEGNVIELITVRPTQ